jgi:hypothetical protein
MADVLESIKTALTESGCVIEPCGSRITCSPPPIDTDQDYLVEIVDGSPSNVARVLDELYEHGFKWEGSEHYQIAVGGFMSWRRDDINMIVTANHAFAERHRSATYVCTRLNLLHKPDRIALFQAVLYGNKWDGESGIKAPAPEMVATDAFDDVPW